MKVLGYSAKAAFYYKKIQGLYPDWKIIYKLKCGSTEEELDQILESSSCGRCWVSTDVGIVTSLYNTIEDNPMGIIIKKNEKAFKDALMKLYNNRELIIEYGINGRKAIEVKWDWKDRIKGFKRLFDQVS